MFDYRIFKLESNNYEAKIYRNDELFEQPPIISDDKETVELMARKVCFNLSMLFSLCGHETNLQFWDEYTSLKDKIDK